MVRLLISFQLLKTVLLTFGIPEMSLKTREIIQLWRFFGNLSCKFHSTGLMELENLDLVRFYSNLDPVSHSSMLPLMRETLSLSTGLPRLVRERTPKLQNMSRDYMKVREIIGQYVLLKDLLSSKIS